jgi:hypothetical protein
MGDEYRARMCAGTRAEDDPYEDWIARYDEVPASLECGATLKARGNYDPSYGLVMYLNLQEYGIRQAEIEGCMAAATAPAKDHFREVWVLWKGTSYLTWRNGKPETERFTRPPPLYEL